MGFEPTTTCLGSKDSTTELRPPREREHESYAVAHAKSRQLDGSGSAFIFCHSKLPSPHTQMERRANR